MGSSLVIRGWKLEVRVWCVVILASSLYFLTSSSLRAQNLEDYQQIAAEQNPGLQAKYKAFEATMERIPQASSLQDPTLSFGYFISPVETRVGPQRARFSLTQMLGISCIIKLLQLIIQSMNWISG